MSARWLDAEFADMDHFGEIVAQVGQTLADVPNKGLHAALTPLIPTLDREVVNRIARYALVDGIRDTRRSATLAVEIAAERAGQWPEEDEDEVPGPITEKDKHGTWNARGKARNGCDCSTCTSTMKHYREWEERDAELRSQHFTKMNAIITDFADAVRIEWTRELLDAGFALPDGTTVLWGDATPDQHAERVQMLTKNAVANAEAAARHRKAIDTLQKSGAATLREAVEGRGGMSEDQSPHGLPPLTDEQAAQVAALLSLAAPRSGPQQPTGTRRAPSVPAAGFTARSGAQASPGAAPGRGGGR